ncbi:MAG TPA: nuclear transport factor 2 family protein [Terriglobales bacterium]|nr:nuclear transport factor 2 family protein [Terriglobales bacterium]
MGKKILGCFLLSLCSWAQAANPSAEQNKLIALERMWNEAQVNRDGNAIASMIADTFVNTEFDGEVSDRGKFIADIRDPKFQPSFMTIDDVKVNVYNSAAIITGVYHTKGTYAGRPYDHIGRFTDSWIYDGGKWLCVASHSTLLKK